jgi:hypothetical protein
VRRYFLLAMIAALVAVVAAPAATTPPGERGLQEICERHDGIFSIEPAPYVLYTCFVDGGVLPGGGAAWAAICTHARQLPGALPNRAGVITQPPTTYECTIVQEG